MRVRSIMHSYATFSNNVRRKLSVRERAGLKDVLDTGECVRASVSVEGGWGGGERERSLALC